jgi:hypothetical protein
MPRYKPQTGKIKSLDDVNLAFKEIGLLEHEHIDAESHKKIAEIKPEVHFNQREKDHAGAVESGTSKSGSSTTTRSRHSKICGSTSKTSRASGIKETDVTTKRNPEWITAKQEYYIRGLCTCEPEKRRFVAPAHDKTDRRG